MTPQNLQDYVKIYHDHVDLSLCRKAVKNLKKINWQQHQFYQYGRDSLVSYDRELDVSYDLVPEKAEIDQLVWTAIKQYIIDDFKDFTEWFDGWNGYTEIRFNRYRRDTQMKIHCDHIRSIFDGQRKGIPMLTVLGALNDDYEGGELYMFRDHRIQLPAGSVCVFPSCFLFPHQVNPVTRGVRYSYVSWVW
jgi:hypothetical protein